MKIRPHPNRELIIDQLFETLESLGYSRQLEDDQLFVALIVDLLTHVALTLRDDVMTDMDGPLPYELGRQQPSPPV